ncbi:MAG: adk, adenylate kinase, adenylate kinase [Candidatus Paceibacter sp.]|jgi:adenylate kinase family enzyme|nr:adk, adenylate kinase, adenylate kinase [Candidatus Paceibacter sp.]
MNPHTFLLFGKSGCGKGTQAKLLRDYLKKLEPHRQVEYIETGSKLREFSQEVGLTAQMTKQVMDEGGLLPSFIPIWIWTNYFIRYFDGNEHLILDGLSRRAYEAPVLDDALKFYKRDKPFVVLINVSDEWAKEHLLARGRSDDNKLDIDSRLTWFKDNVQPTIEYFKKNPYYTVLEINGEQSIEDVHAEIVKKAGI